MTHRRPTRAASRALLSLVAVTLAACGGGDGGSDPVVPTQLQKTAGDQGTGTVGQQTTAPALKVTDAAGRVARGVVVNFSVGGGGTLGATVDTTDAQGVATAGSWTLGPSAGAQSVTATSAQVAGATATFTTTANAGPAARLAFSTQPPGGAVVSTDFAGPVVDVQDSFGNRTASTAPVTLSLNGTGGLGTLSGTTTVNAVAGRATFGPLQVSVAGNGITLVATSAGLAQAASTPMTISSTGPAALQRVSGETQLGVAGTPAFIPPTVRVVDNTGAAVGGATVNFTVTSGGGSVTTTVVQADANGVASAGRWTLGATVGTQTVRASTGSLTLDFNANALAAAPYHIELRYVNIPTARQQQAFEAAWLKWRAAISADLQDIGTSTPISNICGTGQTFTGTVDDLVIYVNLRPIDGQNNVLGSAGPCALRPVASGSVHPNLPAIGVMTFDTADLPSLENSGQLDQVILHEMGHVLGIGTVWDDVGLLKFAGTDTSSFDGTAAKNAWTTLGGASGTRVPVENCVGVQNCGEGTRDGHWRELTFRTELMTGFLNGGVANPLSAMTLHSLADLGYTVNLGAAEAYVLPSGAASTGAIRGAMTVEGPGRAIVEGPQSWDRFVLDGRGGWRRLPPKDR